MCFHLAWDNFTPPFPLQTNCAIKLTCGKIKAK